MKFGRVNREDREERQENLYKPSRTSFLRGKKEKLMDFKNTVAEAKRAVNGIDRRAIL